MSCSLSNFEALSDALLYLLMNKGTIINRNDSYAVTGGAKVTFDVVTIK